jgi:hypothetical protein
MKHVSIDKDCQVTEGMREEAIAIGEPKHNRIKVSRKEKTSCP